MLPACLMSHNIAPSPELKTLCHLPTPFFPTGITWYPCFWPTPIPVASHPSECGLSPFRLLLNTCRLSCNTPPMLGLHFLMRTQSSHLPGGVSGECHVSLSVFFYFASFYFIYVSTLMAASFHLLLCYQQYFLRSSMHVFLCSY